MSYLEVTEKRLRELPGTIAERPVHRTGTDPTLTEMRAKLPPTPGICRNSPRWIISARGLDALRKLSAART